MDTAFLEGADWRKSSKSDQNGSCVEVKAAKSSVAVRDTKDRQGAILVFGDSDWRAFLASIPN